MSQFSQQTDLHDMLNRIINYSSSGQKPLTQITLKQKHFKQFIEQHKPESNGDYYFRQVLIRQGRV